MPDVAPIEVQEAGPSIHAAARYSRPRMPPARAVQLVVFVVGAASLGSEIAAARLLAPWFGASTIVWANTIGTVLVALSVGYAIGGRWADRDPTFAGLCRVVLTASVVLAAVPFVAGPFLRVSVDALDNVEAGAFVGSLLAVMVLIAAPLILLGMVAPYAVRLSVRGLDDVGTIAGGLYAISTVGSLVGVFTAALAGIPLVGTRRTFLLFALALAAVALLGLRGRVRLRAVLAPAAMAVLVALPVGTLKAAGDADVIWEAETEYQYARVVEDDDGERTLELNEGQAIHSIFRPGRVLTDGYWDEPLVLPFARGARPPRSVGILGGGAGTVARSFGVYFPGARVDLVELDGELLDVGRELFDLRGPDLHTHSADARPWLRRTERRFDVLFVDAYRQPYIPFYLATKEFFELCRDRLEPGGMVIVNVGHPEGNDDLEEVLGATMGAVFDTVLRDPSEDTNTQLVGTDAPASAATLRRAVPGLPADLRPLALDTAARLGPRLPGGRVYTDDEAPVEWLVDASIVEVAADGER